MATMYFDTVFPLHLNGEIHEAIVKDKDATINHVLEKGIPWEVDVEWHVWGPGAKTLGGEWKVYLRLESMGDGFEGTIKEMTKAYTDVDITQSTPAHRHWKVQFLNLPDPLPQEEEGIYKLICLITYKDPFGVPAAMAGSLEGPLITFYKSS